MKNDASVLLVLPLRNVIRFEHIILSGPRGACFGPCYTKRQRIWSKPKAYTTNSQLYT